MYMYKMILFVLCLGTTFTSSSLAGARMYVEYGFTPNHVYALWDGVDVALTELENKIAEEQSVEIPKIIAQKYSGKKPADVLVLVEAFYEKLGKLRAYYQLPYKALDIKSSKSRSYEVTPSIVYTFSGEVVDNLSEVLIKAVPNETVSRYYPAEYYQEKTPSDVFGYVERANKRLMQLLAYVEVEDNDFKNLK